MCISVITKKHLKFSQIKTKKFTLIGVLVFYYCVIHHHKSSGLKYYKFVISQFQWVKSLGMDQLGSLLRISQS